MDKDENRALFLSLLAAAAESDDDEEIHRICTRLNPQAREFGLRLCDEMHTHPRFRNIPGNIWSDVDFELPN